MRPALVMLSEASTARTISALVGDLPDMIGSAMAAAWSASVAATKIERCATPYPFLHSKIFMFSVLVVLGRLSPRSSRLWQRGKAGKSGAAGWKSPPPDRRVCSDCGSPHRDQHREGGAVADRLLEALVPLVRSELLVGVALRLAVVTDDGLAGSVRLDASLNVAGPGSVFEAVKPPLGGLGVNPDSRLDPARLAIRGGVDDDTDDFRHWVHGPVSGGGCSGRTTRPDTTVWRAGDGGKWRGRAVPPPPHRNRVLV